MPPQRHKVSALWSDIAKGYSEVSHVRLGKLFLRHFTYLDQAEMDASFGSLVEKAVSRGIPMEGDQLKTVAEKGIWTPDQEAEIPRMAGYIRNLQDTKSKLFHESEKDRIQAEMDGAAARLSRLKADRAAAMGWTAERYAEHVLGSMHVSNSVFRDRGMRERLFSYDPGNMEETDDADIIDAQSAYESKMLEFTEANIRAVALSPVFLNCFYLCDNNPFIFFGKPSSQLTVFQVSVFVHGCNFKAILGDPELKPPPEVMDDPDALVSWHERAKGAGKMVGKAKEGESVGIAGLKAGEYRKLGIEGEDMSAKLSKAAKAKGGMLSMEEIMKLHGV